MVTMLGVGGMGTVYLAEHPLIGKKVALKVISGPFAKNPEAVGRFMREARAAGAIGHPNIVAAHDFGVLPTGEHFCLMEYVEGRTLARVLDRERVLAVPRALHIGAQIAAGLGAAHRTGVIHRDIKPDNIMLTQRGREQDFVKVLDFGLAKVRDGSAPDGEFATAVGIMIGTPQYMAPELCKGHGDADHRVDIYALGVLLFQMLTGRLPFDAESMAAVLLAQVHDAPPALRAIVPEIPPAVEQIVLRCLAKDRNARFASMVELRDALLAPDAYLAGVAPDGSMPQLPTTALPSPLQPPRQPPRSSTAGLGLTPSTESLPPVVVPANHTVRMREGTWPAPRLPVASAKRRLILVLASVGLVIGIVAGVVARGRKRTSQNEASHAPFGSVLTAPADAASAPSLSVAPSGGDAAASPEAPRFSPDANDDASGAGPAPAAQPATAVADARPDRAAVGLAPTPLAAVTVAVTSSPPGASVLVDGVKQGVTPLDILVDRDAVEVTLARRGYITQKRILSLAADATLHVVLRRDRAPAGPRSGDELIRPGDI